MAQVKHRDRTSQKLAATSGRAFRSFLLMAQFEAREIGARIQQARKEKGLTQEELAEMASFSKRSLQDYENGVTIPYRHLRELGQLLDKPVEWFLYGDEVSPPAAEDRLAEVLEAVAELRAEVQQVRSLAEALLQEAPPRARPSTRPGR